METDFLDYLDTHETLEKASFHMPGHKGQAFFARVFSEMACEMEGTEGMEGAEGRASSGSGNAGLEGLFSPAHDITEIPGADDLRHPEGIIKSIEDLYQDLYGSDRSYISVNGSSALIMAAVKTCVREGHKLVAGSNSHISVRNGAKLAGAELVTIEPEVMDGSSKVPCGISPEKVQKALEEDRDADTVLITSPNYFGMMSDIRKIADITHDAGKILIVDEAHGAHLKFFDAGQAGDQSSAAEDLGADIVIVSTHKTLCSFTQTAVANLFVRDGIGTGAGGFDPEKFREELLMLESTSPSYILMESLAVNALVMKRLGKKLIEAWKADLDWFYEEAGPLERIRVLDTPLLKDRSKIVIDFSGAGLNGDEAQEELIKRGIYPEFVSGNIVMFLTGIGNVRADYELLISAIREMESAAGGVSRECSSEKEGSRAERLVSPGEIG